MSFISMADNYSNNQSMINCKSNFKTTMNKSTTISDQRYIRKPWRIFCYNCKLYTESIEPIIIRRSNSHSFAFLAACNNCENLKTLALSDYNCEKFPRDYFNLPLHKLFLNNVVTDKGKKRNILKDLFYIINEPLDK